MDAVPDQQLADLRIANEIMRQLRRAKLRRRPFAFLPPDAYDDTLQATVIKEVHRSIERVRGIYTSLRRH